MDLYVPRSNPCGEEEAYSLQRPCTPKVFRLMILTMTLSFQRVGFGREETFILFFWKWKTTN